jgi:hypothetical protein
LKTGSGIPAYYTAFPDYVHSENVFFIVKTKKYTPRHRF